MKKKWKDSGEKIWKIRTCSKERKQNNKIRNKKWQKEHVKKKKKKKKEKIKGRYHIILVWTQRVKPGFMHALGNTPTLNLVLRGSLDHRTVSRSVGSQNGADPGSLGLSGAPDTGPWTP